MIFSDSRQTLDLSLTLECNDPRVKLLFVSTPVRINWIQAAYFLFIVALILVDRKSEQNKATAQAGSYICTYAHINLVLVNNATDL